MIMKVLTIQVDGARSKYYCTSSPMSFEEFVEYLKKNVPGAHNFRLADTPDAFNDLKNG